MSDRWQRITDLFHTARSLSAEARGGFLEASCGQDQALREEVESLLEQDRTDDRFLSEPAVPGWGPAVRQAAALPQPGDVLSNRYRIECPLAGGGQAMVYRAVDQALSRPVVIKLLRVEGRDDEWLRARLVQEREALARIDHSAVVGILDTGELADGSPFLVIQYIEGESLRQALHAGPLKPARAAAIVRQIGSALSVTHAAGIAHRDLKPENIMLQRLGDGTEAVKLIDFGIAKIERSRLDPDTTTVMVAGSVRYMAPEQFQGENSPASDVYSLGLVACEMLCGQPDERALGREFDGRVRRALECALAFRPEDRPRNVREWCERVAEALTTSSRRRFAMAAGGVAAAMAGGWLMATRRAPPREEAPRIIEKVGAFDPLDEGFQIPNQLTGTVTWNAARTALEGWRVTSPTQGHYYRRLTERQKKMAVERGWRLSAQILAEEGASFADVDFAGLGPRFTINVIAEENRDVVRLVTQIFPEFEGLDVTFPRTERAYHRCDLRYDHGLESAALWVDERKAIVGYRGFRQFQDDRGVSFGVSLMGSERATGTFKSVRFEINP